MLLESAPDLRASQSALGAYFRRMCARLDSEMAAIFSAWATRLAVRLVAPDNSLPPEILVPGQATRQSAWRS